MSWECLPTDIQYRIHQFSGAETPVALLNSKHSPDLQLIYDDHVAKAHEYFLSDNASMLAKWAWAKASSNDEISYTQLCGNAYQNISKKLKKEEKDALRKKWGKYSLEVGRIKETEQIIQDRSLKLMWGKVRKVLVDMSVTALPSKNASASEVRSWMQNTDNQKYLKKVTCLNLSGLLLPLIPEEIRYFNSLKALDLYNNKIDDLSPLTIPGTFPSLTRLYLFCNEIESLEPLATSGALPKLSTLFLAYNRVRSLAPLASPGALPNLRVLSIHSNKISDLTPFAAPNVLFNLKKLLIGNNQIEDASPLEARTGLEVVNLRKNFIKTLPRLMSFSTLVTLDVGNNFIMDISPLERLKGLITLKIDSNLVDDFSPIRALDKLRYIRICNNICGQSLVAKLHPRAKVVCKNDSFSSLYREIRGIPIKHMIASSLKELYQDFKTKKPLKIFS